MTPKSFATLALAALLGATAAVPAMANDVRIEQYGWANSAGGSQHGGRNRIRVYQNGGHNGMTGHGPDADTFAKASAAALKPVYLADTLAFMFETRWVLHPTARSLAAPGLQAGYHDCWRGLQKRFRRP